MSNRTAFEPAGPVRSLGYRALWTCADAFQKLANGCLYVSAGLLRRNELRIASQLRWGAFGTSVDDREGGLAPWERELYSHVVHPADRVLLVGCGTGRDLMPLLESGCQVTGLEQASELAEMAKAAVARRGLTATILTGVVETQALSESYDVVIFSNGCYSTLQQSASRIAALLRLKNHLTDRGRIAITHLGLEHQSRLSVWVTRMSAAIARADWRPEAGDIFSRDHLVSRNLRYEHLFRPGEVARECADAGLHVVRDQSETPSLHSVVAVPSSHRNRQ